MLKQPELFTFLIQTYYLSISDTLHTLSPDNINTSSVYSVLVSDSNHNPHSDSISLLQTYIIYMQESRHILASDNISLNLSNHLVVQDSLHILSNDNFGLSIEAILLSLQESLHIHTIDNILLLYVQILIAQDGFHSHFVDNISVPISKDNEFVIENETSSISNPRQQTSRQSKNVIINSMAVINLVSLPLQNIKVDSGIEHVPIDSIMRLPRGRKEKK